MPVGFMGIHSAIEWGFRGNSWDLNGIQCAYKLGNKSIILI